jgi:hypothetical protein
MPRLFVTALVVVLVLTPPGTTRPEAPARGMKASEVFKAANAMAAALGDDVWPGFDARRYISTQTDRATGAVSVVFQSDPRRPGEGFFWQTEDAYFRDSPPEENVLHVFHEAFHGFQRDPQRPGARWRTEPALLLFDYAAAPARNQALFTVEGRVLRAALRAADDEAARKGVRRFLAVRRLRQGELAPHLVGFEKGAESNEGLAEYAGARAVVAGMKAARDRRVEVPFTGLDPAAYLREKYTRLDSLASVGRNDRLKFYYTGSAQAFLLDRLLPGWKERVQKDAAVVQDLLAEAVGAGPDAAEPILKEHGYEAAAKEAEEEAARRKAEGEARLGELRGRKGPHVTLDVSALGRMGDYRGFDPMNVTVLDRDRRLHTRFAHFGQDKSYDVQFDQPVLEDRKRQEYFTALPAGGRATAVVDGADLALDRPCRRRVEKKVVLRADGLHLEAGPGEVEVTMTGAVVRVARRPE